MRTLFAALLFLLATLPVLAAPLGHAHNDYEHGRPLLDALEHGFGSVEADVWLRDGALLVGHDEVDLRPERTLQSLYLDPLHEMWLAGTLKPLVLLIDIKSEAEVTYRGLAAILSGYQDMLNWMHDGERVPGPVTVVVSGNRPKASMLAEPSPVAFYDGRLSDLGGDLFSPEFMPLVSDNWTRHFSWAGRGPMPESEQAKLRDIIGRAHDAGYKVRFWATPDGPGPERDAVWQVLAEEGVDFINTDDLAGLAAFLRAAPKQDQVPR